MYYTFRATFESLKTGVNRLAIRLPGPLTLEVYHAGPARWKVRTAGTSEPWPNVLGVSPEHVKEIVAGLFDRQITGWQQIAPDGKARPPVKPSVMHKSPSPPPDGPGSFDAQKNTAPSVGARFMESS
ncbi:hypothetical protein EPO44_10290 [bacterium]|nr:MAG: hypothetical protein EPO44_10290 [bacterium]